MLDIKAVRKIAELARIKLTPEEEKRHAETISVVLDYMNILDEVEVGGVGQTYQVTGLEDVFRVDQVKECDYKEELIKTMPQVEGGKLEVPGVFNNPDE